MKRAVLVLLTLGWLGIALGAWTDGPLTRLMNLRTLTDENGYLRVSGGTPGVTDGPLTPMANLAGRTDENGYLRVSFAGAQTISVPNIQTTSTDGMIITNPTASLVGTTVQRSPRLKFCGSAWKSNATAVSETDCWTVENRPVTGAAATTSALWFSSSIAGAAYTDLMSITSGGSLVGTGGGVVSGFFGYVPPATGYIQWNGRSTLLSPSNGNLSLSMNDQVIGAHLKVDALPTAGTCGTSPAVTAGSTPFAGSVDVGTGGIATSCTVTWNGTAFPAAPFCAVSQTAGATVTYPAPTTTTIVLTTTTAWPASTKLSWICVGSKS